jgi:hypothetical protein
MESPGNTSRSSTTRAQGQPCHGQHCPSVACEGEQKLASSRLHSCHLAEGGSVATDPGCPLQCAEEGTPLPQLCDRSLGGRTVHRAGLTSHTTSPRSF